MNSRIALLILWLLPLIAALSTGLVSAVCCMGIYLYLVSCIIWYSDEIGGYTGLNFGVRPAITQETPGCFIAMIGWLLLLLTNGLLVLAGLQELFLAGTAQSALQ